MSFSRKTESLCELKFSSLLEQTVPFNELIDSPSDQDSN